HFAEVEGEGVVSEGKLKRPPTIRKSGDAVVVNIAPTVPAHLDRDPPKDPVSKEETEQ
ncbi:unnamed protein product, partial [marine sediment metagenome]